MGGLEIVADLVAKGLSQQKGIEVKLITLTKLGQKTELETSYEIIRLTNSHTLWKAIKWCDVFVHHGLSLKAIFPLFFYKRKWFVIHHLPYLKSGKKNHFFQYLKQYLTKFCHNISVSEYVRKTLKGRGIVIYNPYNQTLFQNKQLISREQSLLFVGRLVSDKGVDLLLTSIYMLKQEGIKVRLDIIGDGPERPNILNLIDEYGLKNQVFLLGERKQEETAEIMNKHKVLVIPSKWDEPFGVIALEGLACGCSVIASNGGGLPEALSSFGSLFEKNNALQLATEIKHTLSLSHINNKEPLLIKKLNNHSIENVSNLYLSAFKC